MYQRFGPRNMGTSASPFIPPNHGLTNHLKTNEFKGNEKYGWIYVQNNRKYAFMGVFVPS